MINRTKNFRRSTIITKKDFDIWVKDMFNSFKTYVEKHDCMKYCCFCEGNTNGSTNRETVIINLKTHKTAFARCHKDDMFDEETGFAIAWAKYNGVMIPSVVKCRAVDDIDAVLKGERVVIFDTSFCGCRRYIYKGTADNFGYGTVYLFECVSDHRMLVVDNLNDCYIV
jgi:hypothetical protein